MPNLFTADESPFPKPKPHVAALIAYKAVADVAAKLSLFVITIVAARRLAPAAFGTFALGSTIGWMAAVAADFGMQMHLARVVAREPEAAGRLLESWVRVRLWTTAATLVVVGGGLSASRARMDVAGPIAALALGYAVSGLVEFLHYFYRGLSRSDIESSLTIWQRAATLVCGLAALTWRPTAGALAIALLVPPVVVLAISLRIARRLSAGATTQPLVREVFRRDVAPIGAGIVLSALYFRLDVFLVQLWSGAEAVGMYNAVFRVIEGLRLFPAAALAVALPQLCRARDLRVLATASFGLVAFAIVVTTVMWPLADLMIPMLFGEPFRAAVPAFRILLLSFPLLSLNYALTHQLIGWDGQRAFAAICGVALAANLALNARLIPTRSIDGAAWATLITELLVTAGSVIALATLRRGMLAEPRLGDRAIA